MKRFIHLLLASGLFLLQILVWLPGLNVVAHEGEQHDNAPAATAAENKPQDMFVGYEFVTPEGCSLSLLTRRALQLYDQQKEDISLTPATIVFAETNVVQRMGSRLLEIGEHVRIDQAVLDEYAQKAKSLTPEHVAAWDVYAAQADFNLNYISPVKTSSASTDKEAKSITPEPTLPKQSPRTNEWTKKPRLNAAWWVAGLIALAGMYDLLGQRKTRK